MRALRIATIGIVLVCAVVFVARSSATKDALPSVGFSMVSTETVTRPGSSPQLVGIWTRLQKSSGEWKQLITGFEGEGDVSYQECFGGPDGIYKVLRSKNEMQLLGAWQPPNASWRSAAFLRTAPQFVRQDVVLGYQAYVFRTPLTSGGYIDDYFSPIIGAVPIKTVDYRSDEGLRVIEPIKIEITEPTDDAVKGPKLAVGFDSINNKIQQLEQSGKKDAADSWRNQLSTVQQSKQK